MISFGFVPDTPGRSMARNLLHHLGRALGGGGGNIVRHSSTVPFLDLLSRPPDSSLRTPKILRLLRSMMPFNGMLTPYCLWSNNKRYSVPELSLRTHVVVPCGTLFHFGCDTLTSSRSPIYNCMKEVVLDEELVLLLSGQGCGSSNAADVLIDMQNLPGPTRAHYDKFPPGALSHNGRRVVSQMGTMSERSAVSYAMRNDFDSGGYL